MRLVSYNILDGGEGRADPLAEVILAQRPDIVAIVEADNSRAFWSESPSGSRWISSTRPGRRAAAALLSRWPIRATINHALLRGGLEKSFLEAEVIEPSTSRAGRSASFICTPRRWKMMRRQRENEIAIVLDAFADHRTRPGLMCLVGDFNSNSPHQQIDPTKCKPNDAESIPRQRRPDSAASGANDSRRRLRRYASSAHIRTIRIRRHIHHPEPRPARRLHLRVRLDGTIRNAWIEHDRLAKYASDHFPIGAEITGDERPIAGEMKPCQTHSIGTNLNSLRATRV